MHSLRALLSLSIAVVIVLGSVPAGAQPEHIWSDSFGGTGIEAGEAVAMDAWGHVYITGYCYSDIDFGGGLHLNAGSSDIYIAKFDPWGTRLWSVLIGDSDYQEGNAITIGPSGDVIVAGRFRGTVNFGGDNLTSAGLSDIWVAKFQSDGTHLWSKRYGDSDTQFAWDVTTDATGDVYLFGQFQGTVDFGGGPLAANAYDDVYVVKLRGADGDHIWSKHCYGAGYDWGKSIAVDRTGSVFVTGFFDSTITFGGPMLTSAGSADIYIAKLGAGGAEVWSSPFGDYAGQAGLGIAVDYLGDVVAVGEFYGTVNFGGGDMTSGGSHDFYVAKFDTDGSHIWSNHYGGVGNQRIGGLDVHAEGPIIIGGHFENTLDFGGGTVLNSVEDHDGFLAALDPSGNHMWSKHFGYYNDQYTKGVAVDAAAGVATIGEFLDSVYYHDTYYLMSNGGVDIGLAKFDVPPVGTCAGALHDLTPDAPLYQSYSSYEERGLFITPMQNFEVCAIGIKMNPILPVPFVARIYEAGGTTRGPLLTLGEFMAAGSGDSFQYAPINFVLEACKDYNISVEYGEPYGVMLHDENDFSLPYDVGGVIRVRDGELWGNSNDQYLPQLSIIGTPLGCPAYVDLQSPDPGWAWHWGSGTRNGIYVTAKKTINVCGLQWEAIAIDAPITVLARIYEASGTTRGSLVASGATVIETSDPAMHNIPITAVLQEGHEYDIEVEFPAGTWWMAVDENLITIPYDVADIMTVRSAEYEGNPAYTSVNHFGLQWSPTVSGMTYELGKHSEVYPPPYTSTQTTHRGVYLTSLADQDIYSLGWRGDSQVGGTLIAWVFEANGIARGTMISEGMTYCEAEGMRWHDVPVSAEFLNNRDYVVEFSFAAATEWAYWDDYTGMPYENYGLFRVYASCHGGSPNWHEIPELRVNACNAAGTAVEEKPDGQPPRFTLGAPRPNPATAMTAIPFSLDEGGPVTIEVYDVAGRRVSVLLAGESRPEGAGSVELDANKLAAGVYFVKMKNGMKSVSRKITIIH